VSPDWKPQFAFALQLGLYRPSRLFSLKDARPQVDVEVVKVSGFSIQCPVPEISMPFAAGQLAVFHGGPSRTGVSDEHI
jgi:hypothetical protein